jgi:hypothetical protein
MRPIALIALLLAAAPISAHEVVVEQIVDATIAPQGDALVVTLHVPIAVTGDPKLTAALAGSDTAAIEERLRIVAADIARNLDVQQEEATVPAPVAMVRRGSDGLSIDVELRYAGTAGARNLSARLNAFSSNDGPVRTNARFRPESGRDQLVTVTGPATRVEFDPPLITVVASFAVRGLRALFDGGDQLLFLVCILLPLRSRRSALTIYAAAALAQALVTVLYISFAPVMAPWVPGATMAAASAIAIAALQNIARARMRWVVPVAVAFGALNGLAFGQAAATSVQFGGDHGLAAMLTFGSVVLLGELWIGTLSWGLRNWIDDRGLPDRVVASVGSVIVAHSAVHRVMARAPMAAQAGALGGEQIMVWLTLIWVGALLFAAVSNAMTNGPERVRAS